MRHSILGTECFRRQLGIGQDDPKVFRPVTLDEAVAAASIVATDDSVRGSRACARVGIVYDLMPLHVRPDASCVARKLRIKDATVRRRELQWEMCPPVVRFELVRRAMRSVIAFRAARS